MRQKRVSRADMAAPKSTACSAADGCVGCVSEGGRGCLRLDAWFGSAQVPVLCDEGQGELIGSSCGHWVRSGGVWMGTGIVAKAEAPR